MPSTSLKSALLLLAALCMGAETEAAGALLVETENVPALVAFYSEVLPFTVTVDAGNFAVLDYGDQRLILREGVSKPGKGVRWLIQGEAPGFTARISNGVEMLAGFGLSFDICVSHDQLPETLQLVDGAPETRFVLDHIGKPDIAVAEWSPWAENIAAIAARENVWCKLSGMVTEADHNAWAREDLVPYAEHILDVFGSGRVMFGSDWPVVTLACEYERWLATARSMVIGSDDEIEAIFSGTARAFYRLPDAE